MHDESILKYTLENENLRKRGHARSTLITLQFISRALMMEYVPYPSQMMNRMLPRLSLF